VASYDVAAVGVLTFVSNWAGSIWWSWAGVLVLLSYRDRNRSRNRTRENKSGEGVAERQQQHGGGNLWKGHVAVLSVFVAGSVVAVMAACTVLRTHLFVWTVFSPKYLYCVAWSLGQHLVVDVGVGGVVYWLGVWEGSK
jgi:ethanolaminephosphotransferase